ncbi:MAG TPA: type II secretion system protein GspD, partial [Gammaproteobacteria bacterium]|nr:type II secretion system protein GspD [Gammaproteobacteria bacterium]
MPSLLLSYQELINKNEKGLMDTMPSGPAFCRFFVWSIVLSLLIVLPLQAEDEEVTLNFKDADLNVVIQTVADITGRNFVIDPRVKGKVTVVSSRPMRADELYQVFLSVLEVHGFAAIPDGDTTRIVPAANAKQAGLPVVTGTRKGAPSNDMITQVVQIKHVSAAQLVPVLRPLVPPQGHMAAYQSTNTLIISDRAANIARLRKIIQSIDQPGSSEVEVIQLQHASAAEVVRILSSLQQKGGKGKTQGIAGPLFVADERTNSILLGGDPAERLRMRRIITELDTPIEVGGGNTQVVYLRYAKAADLAKVLMGISEAEKKAAQQQAGGRKMGQVKGGKSISSVTPAGRAVMANISIQADEGTNALIITAPPDQFRSLQAVIAKLDIPRAQVLVETIIAEVSLDRKRELGVEWIVDGTSGGSSSGMAPIGTIDFGGISGLAGSIASAKAGKGVTLSSGLAMVVGNIGGAGTDFGALLRALTSDGSTNVLSTPNIVTMDNEEAEIVVGENRPFVTGSFTSTGGGSTPTNPFQTIKREDG